eukprot:TRINITY_DN4786_c0_g1_i2.p3 TRINITY_DN4786_c0_g1~~TRINITY_DN4786_c0_g1_i2.p3  ORF type:complete len:176 (-),score=30.96 TRINITY_DN4786_c0_g1_i2:1769-2296(-)
MSSKALFVSVFKVPRRRGADLVEISDSEHIRVNPRGRPLIVRVACSDTGVAIDYTTLRLSLLNVNTSVAVEESKPPENPLWIRKDTKIPLPAENAVSTHVSVAINVRSDFFAFRATASDARGMEVHGAGAKFYASDSGQSRAERKAKARKAQREMRATISTHGNLDVRGKIAAKD